MTYAVKEIYYTLQGEGANAGRPAVFCRFAGCNLWSGREADRKTAICRFCDTDFLGVDGPGGGRFESARDLVARVEEQWPGGGKPLVVFTGGEPLLQLDAAVIEAAHAGGFEVAVETNGTLPSPGDIDWVCVSPKAHTSVVLTCGDELKLVYPQPDADPRQFVDWEFEHFYLQPMDGPELRRNTELAVEYCLRHPQWKLSVQTHKLLGLP